jgi:hypothetical protein
VPEIITLPEWRNVDLNNQVVNSRRELRDVPVATQDELLEFANRLREAGGAELLTDLPVGLALDATQCLIASSLNFESQVDAGCDEVGEFWYMRVGFAPFTQEQVGKIEAVMGSRTAFWTDEYEEYEPPVSDDGTYAIAPDVTWRLPEHIGHAADAFDRGVRFNEYRFDG